MSNGVEYQVVSLKVDAGFSLVQATVVRHNEGTKLRATLRRRLILICWYWYHRNMAFQMLSAWKAVGRWRCYFTSDCRSYVNLMATLW